MITFRPSAELVRKIVQNLKNMGLDLPEPTEKDFEMLRVGFGDQFGGTVSSYAQAVRYFPEEKFLLIQNGKFPEEFDQEIGGMVSIPEGTAGDELMRELASEVLAWIDAGGGKESDFSPRHPIAKMVRLGDDLTVYVRPKEPDLHDPNFVRATEVG